MNCDQRIANKLGMVRLKRNVFIGLILLATLFGLINAGQDWIFIGTNLQEYSRGRETTTPLNDLFQKEDNRSMRSEIKRYLWANSTENQNVLRNFKQTPIIRNEVRDKAYYDDKLLDHACPVNIRASLKEPVSRIPDVIGVGFAKCGTGALAFLDCHPRAVFRTTEPRFFDQKRRLEEIKKAFKNNDKSRLNSFKREYARRCPNATEDELLIEKSPQYAGGSEEIRMLRAQAMKIINPNAKLIAVICDPIKRAYSQLSMKWRRTKARETTGKNTNCRSCLKTTLEEAIGKFTGTMEAHLKNNRESGYAAFSNYLKPFQDVFGEDKILIVDGENLIKNANVEFTRIVKFLELDTEHFNFNTPDQKGFPCLQEPIKFCLNGAKGTSRKEDIREKYPQKTQIWKETFAISIKKTIITFKICAEINEACCHKLQNRFAWATQYFCN